MQARQAQTSNDVIAAMREAAAARRENSALLNSIIDLFETDNALYWVKIRFPQEFVAALASLFNNDQIPSTRQLARKLFQYQKNGNNNLILERVNDPDRGLMGNDTTINLLWKAAEKISATILEERQVMPPINDKPKLAETIASRLIQEEVDAKAEPNAENGTRLSTWNVIAEFIRRLSYPEQIDFVRKLNTLKPEIFHDDEADEADEEKTINKLKLLLDPQNRDYRTYQEYVKKIQDQYRNLNKSEADAFSAVGDLQKKGGKNNALKNAKLALNSLFDSVFKKISEQITDHSIMNKNQWNEVLQQIFTVPEEPTLLADIPLAHRGKSIVDAPIETVLAPDLTDKWSLIEAEPFDMANARPVSPKGGGANNPGSEGCIAEWIYFRQEIENDPDPDPNLSLEKQTIFFKQPTDPEGINYLEIMSEVTGAMIMHSVAPYQTAAVSYAIRPDKTHNGKDQDVYIASYYFDDFMDINRLRTYPNAEMPRNPLMDFAFNRDIQQVYRGLVFGTFSADKDLKAGDKLHNLAPLKGLGRGIAANLLVNNRQFHIGNNGIGKRTPDDEDPNPYEFKFIDLGGALRNKFVNGKRVKGEPFTRAVHPHTSSGAKNAFAYIQDIPIDVRLSQGYIEEIIEVANSDQEKLVISINAAVDAAKRNFSLPIFRKHFAEELGIEETQLLAAANNYEELIIVVKGFLIDRVLARQLSLREYALDLQVSVFAEPEKQLAPIPLAHRPPTDANDFNAMVEANPFWFMRGRYHFRGAGQSDYDPALTTHIQERANVVLHDPGNDAVHALLLKDLNFIRFPDSAGMNKEAKDTLNASKIKTAATLMLARVEFIHNIFNSLSFEDDELNDQAKIKLQKDLLAIKDRLSFALEPGKYNFKNEDDLGIVVQMCDESFRQITKTLRAVNAANQAKLIPLMTFEGDTKLAGAQQEYLQKVLALTKSSRSAVSHPPLNFDQLVAKVSAEKNKKEKKSFVGVLLEEMLGNDNNETERTQEQIKEDAFATFQEIRKNLSLSEQTSLIRTLSDFLDGNQLNVLNAAFDLYSQNVKNKDNKDALKAIIKSIYKEIDPLLRTFQERKYKNKWKALLTQLLTVPESDPAYFIPLKVQGRSLTNVEVPLAVTTVPEAPDCLTLRPVLSRQMAHSRWVGTKVGGARGKGTPYGGWYISFYRNENGKICTHPVLFKQDDSSKDTKTKRIQHFQDVSETVATYVLNGVGGDTSSSVILASCPPDPTIEGDDKFYIGSIAFPNFTPSFKKALKALNVPDREIPEEHAKFIGLNPQLAARKFKPGIIELMKKGKLKNLAVALVLGLLIDNRDIHGDNVGESVSETALKKSKVEGEEPKGQYKILDHGSATKKLARSVHARKSGLRTLKSLGKEPTNHFLDYPLEFILSEEMTSALDVVATASRKDLVRGITEGLKEIDRVSETSLREYADWAGIKLKDNDSRKMIFERLRESLVATHVGRQYSLKEFSLEIQLTRCFADYSLVGVPKWADANSKNQFRKLVEENPAYFLRGRNNGYHIRALGNVHKLFLELTGECKNFIYNTAVEILSSKEAQHGIRSYLLQDFDIYRIGGEDKTSIAAETTINRLTLMMKLLKDDVNSEKLQILLKDLKNALEYFQKPDSETPYDPEKEDRKKLVIQVCDSAFREMANIYDLLPESSKKIHIYEVFKSIARKKVENRIEARSRTERFAELQQASTDFEKYRTDNKITVSDSPRIEELREQVNLYSEKLSRATSDEEVDIIIEKIEKIKAKIDMIAKDSIKTEEEGLFALQALAKNLVERAETEKTEIAKEKSAYHSDHVEMHYHAEMKSIPLRKEFLQAASSSVEAAVHQFQQMPSKSETANIKMNGGKSKERFFVPEESTFYKDPTDEENSKDDAIGVTGFVVDLKTKEGQTSFKEPYMCAQEVKQRDDHRLTYRIAKQLLEAKSIIVVHKGFISPTKESRLVKLITLTTSSSDEKTDALAMEKIVKECMEQEKIDPAKPLTDANAKQLLKRLTERKELTFCEGSGYFRSTLAKPEHIKKIVMNATTSSQYKYDNLPPLELMIYAKVWADRLAKFIKRKGVTGQNGFFDNGKNKRDLYDPTLVELRGSTDVNIPLIRSIILAIAARYDFKTHDLKKFHLSKYIKDRLKIVAEGENVDLTREGGKLLITSKDIQDARNAYRQEGNPLYEAMQRKKIILPVEPDPSGPAAAAA